MSYLQEPQLIYFVHYGVALNMRIQEFYLIKFLCKKTFLIKMRIDVIYIYQGAFLSFLNNLPNKKESINFLSREIKNTFSERPVWNIT
ncbi:protein of unknown function [Xenorhabdus doucetiae]|uniref:Uncharacterized protein n=1 Tax=Xenorhabdus doucetiae TaxID=351671 RepID=A0A068QR24_9GAMM|nr:protein of unknown function [Xenorhabdus doucetiae]